MLILRVQYYYLSHEDYNMKSPTCITTKTIIHSNHKNKLPESKIIMDCIDEVGLNTRKE